MAPWIAKSAAILALLAAWVAFYGFAVRPGQLRWGATAEELTRPMPGDDLVGNPSLWATRAVTISGRPEDIWPWIVQIGYGRAGFYGYDLIENPGSPRGIRSAREIVPELQRPGVGDRVYMSRIAYLLVHSLAPNQFLTWVADERPPHGAFTFELFPLDERRTRLVVRARLRYHWTEPSILLDLFTEFGDHVAIPRMLLGIKDRVEGRPVEALALQGIEIAVWAANLLECAVAAILILVRRRWGRAWAAALAASSALLFVLYARQPLWAGLLLQAPVLAAVGHGWRADSKETR